MTLRPYQTELRDKIYAAWREPNVRNVVAVAPTGAGKCLGRDTPVLMYDGCVMPVQNILPGMSVMGPDSQPRLVTSICRGVGQLYRVVPKKGDPYVVNDAHILSLKRTREKTGGSKNLVVNLNVEEFARSNKWTRHLLKGWRTSVTFNNDAMLPIDPYFLGVWLAEGSIGGQAITTPEPEIKQYLFSFAAAYNYGINIIPGKNCETINIHNYRNRKYGPLHILRALTVINEKHIPHLYKTASRQDRLILLAGYLDGDGYLCKNYYDAICNTERLANDIAFLARSLGFACYIRKCVKGIKSYGFSADYWRLSISGDISQIPCRVERRKAKERRQKKDVLVTSINIEPIGIGEYFGFELAGKDGLFLLGDFTVTHNTKIKASIFAGYRQPAVAIAHRQELVGQISLALAQEGVIHRIVAPDIVRAFCVSKHVEALGKSFHHASSPVAVAGIDTLNARHEKLIQWINTVRLWDIDEAHHVLAENKWGKGVKLFTNAYGVGFTATPGRPDRRGLGRHASGVFDRMVIGPTMRPLIDAGFLADYRIFVPPASYTMTEEDVSDATGDYKPERLRAKSHSSTITGDIVSHYLRIAPGKRGITFTVDVETAAEVAQAFNNAGVPAASVSAKTPDAIRDKLISKFRRGDLKQLVNVDIFGEGFDVPAVEVVSDGRSTKSFPRYAQAFGRALRPADGKTHGVYIDHVSNVKVHGVPDRPRVWTLDDERGKRRAADASDSVRVCYFCFNAYEPFRTCCPYCGHKPTPANRSTPQFVDGDLIELDPVVLMQMRGEIERIDANGPVIPLNLVGTPAEIRLRRVWNERQAAQVVLRDAMNHWAGMQQTLHGLSDSELYRKFYHEFGTDVLTAQTFGRYDTERLLEKIRESWV